MGQQRTSNQSGAKLLYAWQISAHSLVNNGYCYFYKFSFSNYLIVG